MLKGGSTVFERVKYYEHILQVLKQKEFIDLLKEEAESTGVHQKIDYSLPIIEDILHYIRADQASAKSKEKLVKQYLVFVNEYLDKGYDISDNAVSESITHVIDFFGDSQNVIGAESNCDLGTYHRLPSSGAGALGNGSTGSRSKRNKSKQCTLS